MRRISTALVCLLAAFAASALWAASASARGLVLTTAGGSVFNGGEQTWSSTSAGFTFSGDEGEEMCGTSVPIKWKIRFEREGSGFQGQVEEKNQVDCALPTGAIIAIEPDPHPWSVALNAHGSAVIAGIGRGIGFTAQLPGGSTCQFDPLKISMRFVVGPIRPIPLEPGDPSIRYRLVRGISDAGCPRIATEHLTMAASTMGPSGEEEPVMATAVRGPFLTSPSGAFFGGDLTWSSTTAGFTFSGDEGEEMCGTTVPLRWRIRLEKVVDGYLGQVFDVNQVGCALPTGAEVSIDPTPVPWSVRLARGGLAPIRGIAQPIGFTAGFPGGATCMFDPLRIPMRFVAGPIIPIPLEPGDPSIRYRLVRSVSTRTCPRLATDLKMTAGTMGPTGAEEPVFVQEF
jgi:hypothetical protein